MPILWVNGKPRDVGRRRKMTGKELRITLGVTLGYDLFYAANPYRPEIPVPNTDEKVTLSWLGALVVRQKEAKPDESGS